jgi:hypothetical protein
VALFSLGPARCYYRRMRLAADIVIGRDEELGKIAPFQDASAELPGALLLEGDAGIGKTTLWRAALEAAGDRSYRIPRGTGGCARAGFRRPQGSSRGRDSGRVPRPSRASASSAWDRASPRGSGSLAPRPRAMAAAFLTTLRLLAEERPLLVGLIFSRPRMRRLVEESGGNPFARSTFPRHATFLNSVACPVSSSRCLLPAWESATWPQRRNARGRRRRASRGGTPRSAICTRPTFPRTRPASTCSRLPQPNSWRRRVPWPGSAGAASSRHSKKHLALPQGVAPEENRKEDQPCVHSSL